MVEYLSAVGNKTLITGRKTLRFPSALKNFRLLLLTTAFTAILLGLGIWAQQGIGGKPQAKINKELSVQARTRDKIRVSDANLKVNLVNAEMANSLLVQGKRAKTREGKTFLIINMEVENTYAVPLYSFPVDLLRLVREDDKRIAPSVHQGTVEVRPISTKKSNVGFVVDPNDKDFKLEVGEVSGEKEILEISFK